MNIGVVLPYPYGVQRDFEPDFEVTMKVLDNGLRGVTFTRVSGPQMAIGGDFMDLKDIKPENLAVTEYLFPFVSLDRDFKVREMLNEFQHLVDHGFRGKFIPLIFAWNQAHIGVIAIDTFLDASEHEWSLQFGACAFWSADFACQGGWHLFQETIMARKKKAEPVVELPIVTDTLISGQVLHASLAIKKSVGMGGVVIGSLSMGDVLHFDAFQEQNHGRFLYGHIDRGWVAIRQGKLEYVMLERQPDLNTIP